MPNGSSDGSIVIESKIDNAKAEKELEKLTKKIENIEREISGRKAEKSKWVQSAQELGVQLDSAKAKLYEMQTAAKGVFSAEQISMQKETVNSLQSQWNAAENQVEKYDRQIQSATIKLNQNKERAAAVADQIARAADNTGDLGGAAEGVSKRFDKLLSRVSKLASRVFIFSMITSGLRSLREWMGDVISTNDEASAAIARLKGALLTMVQPLVDVVIPAFTAFVNLLTAIIGKIASFVALLGGTTAEEAAKSAKALNDQTKALNSTGKAAQKAGKYLAGFDEINQIGGTASDTAGAASTDIEPDFSWTDSISEDLDRIADLILLIGSGLALWKIGSMLPGALGTIATTLGLILATIGGLLLYWDGLSDAWENGVDWMNLIEMVGGLAVAAFGLYQLFGPIAAGILLVVGGLAMLVTAFHDAMESGWSLQNVLLAIAGIIATGLGITLITGTFIPLLIAGIAALLLALTVSAGHGEELIQGIQDICQGFVDFITGIFTGDIEKALGGIESMFSGIGKVVQSIFSGVRDTILSFLDWLDEKTGGKLSPIINFIKGLFSGLFDGISNMASGTIDGVKQIFSGLVKFISGVFTRDWGKAWDGVKDIFKGLWNSVISILEGAVNLIIKGLNWLIKQMNKISFTVPSWVPSVGGKSVGINIPSIKEYSLPRLATGTVIPPNHEFAAILGDQKHGTNIEAPLETIQEAVAAVMEDYSMANLAGHEATVEVLREILQAVLGIEIGDEVIGKAAARYTRKMNIMRGGV